MRRLIPLLAIAPAFLLLAGTACTKKSQETGSGATVEVPLKPTPGKPWFVDVTSRSGIDFVHYDCSTPTQYIFENMTPGVALFDYDNDGWLDLFCVQDGPVHPGGTKPLPTHKLYRNNGDGTFTDVTKQVGLDVSGMGMGCAVGDYDNDGFDDLVVTYLDHVSLFHNVPDGKGGRRFVDVTADSKISDPHWATSCAWGDIDGDGLLDLYICNYVEIDLKNYKPCISPETHTPYNCPPTVFPYTTHKLFRNNGNGTFTDVSESSGIASAKPGGGLAVAFIDLDGDGKIDIYVANDMENAYLFKNMGGGRFKELGPQTGTALMPNGRRMAGMGIGVGDIDNSGRPSLLVSNYQDEPTMVFLNRGNMIFREYSHPSGLGPASFKVLSFGIDMLDADLDGNLDVVQANGHVIVNDSARNAPYKQQAQLFLGDGQAHFTEVTDTAGPFFREKHLGRGLAIGDFDNDGKPDFVIGLNGETVRLLHNETDTTNHWLRLELIGDGKKSNRNAIGARVEIETGGRKLVRWVTGGGSYLSASDRRLLVGLGKGTRAERVRVVWPSGQTQEYVDLPADSSWRLSEGEAKPAKRR